MALKDDGTVWAWGQNNNGQLGDGTTTRKFEPIKVSGLSNISAIAVGSNYSLALVDDGTVWAWGDNYRGQLGDGTNTDRLSPVKLPNFDNVSMINTGNEHAFALKNDGTVWAWGYNSHGQLGDDTTTDKNIPNQISNINNVIDIVGGSHNSLALKKDGTVWAWGYGGYGQLGNGTTMNKDIPAQVSGLGDVMSITSGNHHVSIVGSDGAVWSWGYNSLGQLGDGTITQRNIPVQVIDSDGDGFLNLKTKIVEEPEVQPDEFKITADDAEAGDNFGQAVSISGDYIIVGSSMDDDNGSNSGSAYIFKRNGDDWTQQTKLLADNGAENDRFGEMVSISGDYAIVSNHGDNDNYGGSARIFKREGGNWSQQATLTVDTDPMPGHPHMPEYAAATKSVVIDGSYAAISVLGGNNNGNGKVYIFERDGENWTKHSEIAHRSKSVGILL